MKQWIKVILMTMIIALPLSAQKGEGFSKPGSIHIPFKTQNVSGHEDALSCQISYDDPSGDQRLSKNEKGTITITVINHSHKTVTPKLDILIQPSWLSRPKSTVKWMAPVASGKNGTYQTSIKWDARMTEGSIEYRAKAIDPETQVESQFAELTFMISGSSGFGPEKEVTEPMFVDVDKSIPRMGVSNKYGVAVIIGNHDYHNKDVPNVEFADNDASTIKNYLINMLGYQDENIMFLNNADKADFERVFGTDRVYKGKLYNWIKPDISDVFVYYSGHGAPDLQNKKAYFMPANSDPNYIQIDGYPLDTFYKNLNKIPAKSITVVIDACFSGGSQQGMIIRNASPMYIHVENPVISQKINLFSSASGDEISSWYPDGNHSLFTYYYLRALRGEADQNRDRKVTVRELDVYLGDNVPYMARRLYGREQTPVVQGVSSHVICSY